MSKFFTKRNLLLAGILLLSFFIRTLWLSSVPTSSNFDQLHYLLDAKSFYETGKDMTGTISLLDVFTFHYPPWSGMQAELPYLLVLLSVGPLGLSLVTAALPNVILGTSTVFLLYLLGKKLVSHRFGIIVALLAAVNPWFIFSSRTVYETVPATFFYLLTLFLFFKLKGKQLLFIIPCMTLAFYSYIGTKLIFLPFIIICLVYSYFILHKKRQLAYHLVILFVSCALIFLFVMRLHNQTTSRINDIFLPNNPVISQEVNKLRNTPLHSSLTPLFENKFTIYGRTLLMNTFNLLSPMYLFEQGDYFFSLQRHGLFYVLDAFFLLIGVITFFKKDKKRILLFTSLLVISIMPQVFHDPTGTGNFTPHIALLIPFLLFIIAAGIDSTLVFPKKKKISYGLAFFIGTCYIVMTVNFLHMYFYQLPLNDSIFVFPNRVVTRYLTIAREQNIPIVAHVANPSMFMREYLVYSGAYEEKHVKEINNLLNAKRYTLGSLKFTQCTSPVNSQNATIIYEAICDYKSNRQPLTIVHLGDNGSAFSVYHDQLCSTFSKRQYVSELRIIDLSVEHLSPKDVCQKYVISY